MTRSSPHVPAEEQARRQGLAPIASVDERVRGKFKVKKFRCFTCGSPHPALIFASSAFTTGVRDDEFH